MAAKELVVLFVVFFVRFIGAICFIVCFVFDRHCGNDSTIEEFRARLVDGLIITEVKADEADEGDDD